MKNIARRDFLKCSLAVGGATLTCRGLAATDLSAESFVRVSPRDARYLEFSNGQPYLAIGVSIVQPDTKPDDEAGGLRQMGSWFQKFSSNGGNFVRLWLGSEFFDVEHERSGVYDEVRAKRIEAVLAMAKRYGICLKMCIEHFRSLNEYPDRPNAPSHYDMLLHRTDRGGPAQDMDDFFTGEKSRAQFKGKLAWFQKRFGSDPAIFAWELWNEINATQAQDSSYMPWTEEMLGELHRLFPQNLAVQSLGSFKYDRRHQDEYRRMSLMPGNDVAHVHRYLLPTSKVAVDRAPMDVLMADAVRAIQAFSPQRPILLAECGAVSAIWTASELYGKDKSGMMLHDMLFAPFFAGAAGPGHVFRTSIYIERNNLWHHYARFGAVVKDLDPPAEDSQPTMLKHPRLRIYQLGGRRTTLLWCRDSQNTWETELEQERAPETLTGQTLDLSGLKAAGADVYDPWQDRWSSCDVKDGMLMLPAFSRSVIVRIAVG